VAGVRLDPRWRQAITIGRVAAAAGWAGLTAIEVHPAHRRRGLARAVTAALAAQASASPAAVKPGTV
jgi:ribosomal protein S18 acetylase RimI-like enzyme